MRYLIIILFYFFISCSNNSSKEIIKPSEKEFISAVDLSALPEIKSKNITFYNNDNTPEDVVSILKKNGVNTVRLKIWNDSENSTSGFEQVKSFSNELHNLGLKVWLTVHYSDTWADPNIQNPPKNWQGISFTTLKDSVSSYTKKIMSEIRPDIIQIGNEINSGLLLPYGNINSNKDQFLQILNAGTKAVRDISNDTKIMIHFAGINNADWFFDHVQNVDYDYIGLSYYPIWHGKNLNELKFVLSQLSEKYQREILIAETAYPFTLDWNDWTNNIVGLENQILSQYPATPQGQKDFITKIKELITSTEKGIGLCYWGGELVAFNGNEAKNGSPWENQALFDFDNKILPVKSAFKF